MVMPNYQFDPDLTRAATIPAAWYTNPAMFPIEREKIFSRTWQLACSLKQLPTPGSFVAVDVCGWPVVLTRDRDDSIRAFHNVCRHRAGVVARGMGCRKTLQCHYHGWLYGLDGSLKHAPEFDDANDFDRAEFGLFPIRVETWGTFAFLNVSGDAPPLTEYLAQIAEESAHIDFKKLKHVERRDYIVNANWKVYVDNYLEGYHVPVAHPGLYRELDYDRYQIETFRYHSSQHAPIRASTPTDPHRVYGSSETDRALYYWLFPNVMFNIYPGNLQLNVVVPLAHDRTLTRFEWYSAHDADTLKDSIAFSDQVQQEDIQLCEDVWRNLQQGVYTQGRYCPKRENGVHHFHGLLAGFLVSMNAP